MAKSKISLQDILDLLSRHQIGRDFENMQEEVLGHVFDDRQEATDFITQSLWYVLQAQEMCTRLERVGVAKPSAKIIASKCIVTPAISQAVYEWIIEWSKAQNENFIKESCTDCFPLQFEATRVERDTRQQDKHIIITRILLKERVHRKV